MGIVNLSSAEKLKTETKALSQKIAQLLKASNRCEGTKAITKSLQILKKNLEKVNTYSCDKYDVVFMGKCGIGKTTLICHWLNLLTKEIIGKSKTEITLLKSASGRTTASEVIIEQTDKSTSIHIEPMSDESVKMIIADVCNNIWKRRKEGAQENDLDTNPDCKIKREFHEEEKRLVLNMAGLKDQEADDFTNSHSKEEFISIVTNRMKLEQRKRSNFTYNGDNFDTWLKETFEKINYGTYNDTPIPYRIHVYINKMDRDLNLPSYVRRVIDTKGLDAEGSRRDLCQYIQNPETICIMLDAIEAVPEYPICKLLHYCYQGQFSSRKDHLSPNCWKDKLALYVCAEDLEDKLASVNQADDDFEKGKKIKISEISSKIAEENIAYKIENTVFVDVLSPYEMVKDKKRKVKVIREFDSELSRDNCDVILGGIERMKESITVRLYNEIEDIQNKVNKLSEEIDAILQKKITSKESELKVVKEKIRDSIPHWKNKFNISFGNQIIDDCLRPKHHQTIKAITSRYGGNEIFYANLYDDIELISGPHIFDECANEVYKEISRILLRSCKEPSNCDRMDVFDKHISDLKSNQCSEFGVLLSKLCSEDVFSPKDSSNLFWVNANNICGVGYTSKILNHYKNMLSQNETKLNNCLKLAGEKWINSIVDLFKDI